MERCLLAFGLQRDRVVLIPNWADGDHLTPVAPEENWFRKQHGLEGQIVVMYSGNLGVVHETEALIPLIRYLQGMREDRKSTRLNSSHLGISYAVFCLKKKIEMIVIHL